MSRDIPIIMQPFSIRGLLAGRKRQTRRGAWTDHFSLARLSEVECAEARNNGCRVVFLNDQRYHIDKPSRFQGVQAGDRLWVREAWRTESSAYDDLSPAQMDADYPVLFDADADWSTNKSTGRARSPIHMPRWASRITLTVTATRIEPLQDISVEDAIAEGLFYQDSGDAAGFWFADETMELGFGDGAVECYEDLWGILHGVKSWEANPDVVVISFDAAIANIADLKGIA
jgi:hypothetical protein